MKSPKGTISIERTLKDMAPADIAMRVSSIVRLLEKDGPLSAKQVAARLKHSEGWAGMYLAIGEMQHEVYRVKTSLPVLWGATSSAPPKLIQLPLPDAVATVDVGPLALPAATEKLLLTLQVFHGCKTMEETIVFIAREHATRVMLESRVSLSAIMDELDRHETEIERLRKGV